MKTEFQRLFYIVAVPSAFIMACAALYFLVLRPGDPVISKPPPSRTSEPGISVRRPEISHLVDGRVTWRVFADSIELDKLSGRTSLEDSTGVFYRDENDPEIRFEFEAPLTVYNEKSKAVESEGHITGRLVPEMYLLEASTMKWSESKGTLTAENVLLKSGGSLLQGGYLELSSDKKMVRLTGGVSADIEVKRNSGKRNGH